MLKIAFRNIFRQKRRTVLTALSMFGGFVLAAFFIGWADGTYSSVIDMFTRSKMGHIQVHEKDYPDRPNLYKTLDDIPKLEAAIEGTAGVDSWAPRLYSAGLVSVGQKTAGVRIIGIDPKKENKTTNFAKKVAEGRMFSPTPAGEVILGKGLAKILKARLEGKVVVVSQAADGSIANEQYSIVGIVDSGDEIEDRMAFYLPLSSAQELMVMEGRIHEVAITIKDLDSLEEINSTLTEKIADPKLVVETWHDFARTFYMSMKADMEGMWVMLVVIVLVVAVGVLNTVLMSVLERRREYGVLKAVGTKPSQIVKMVLMEVNCLGIMCVIAGTIVGLGINYLLSLYGISLSEPMTVGGMQLTSIHGEINARSFYIPGLTVIISATLVSIIPALKAAHTDPVKSMRVQ
ncbi:MAG: ABC transporter permease [bacterium]|nr:ABC transporter permease [bacterium]